ncbi:MAG TPA: erythromycin esterase family protein [Candidatus Thermoplasmatota archaeon]|nr:erythromycin esterase family protein [Candidatus Thermoplasmatota archaeon]
MIDLDALIERASGARYVLLGEASHGTSEYYTWRSRITKRLIEEHGFSFVAVEGDWPDCAAIDRWVRSPPDDERTAAEALRVFERWPTWMWANHEVAELITWMRERNWDAPPGRQARFYGLDLYSLWDSLDAVVRHLEEHAPEALPAAREAMRCFGPYGRDEQRYADATTAWVPETCEGELVRLLAEARRAGTSFDAEQNALVARNAERYYRTMMRGGAESWNVRDRHMVETLERLMAHHGPDAKCIVWEHNTHVGDARATDMAAAGMVNVGQLVREAHPPEDVFVLGFGSYEGSVIAGSYWGAPFSRFEVPEAQEGSWEEHFHDAGGDRLVFREDIPPGRKGHRAIGVVYDPYVEAWGNYVPTVLRDRYDAFLFLDRTHALRPLHVPVDPDRVPETYPTGE